MPAQNMQSSKHTPALIATNRFGYGAKGDEIEQATKNPKAWVIASLQPVSFDKSLPHSNDILADFSRYRSQQKKKKSNPEMKFGVDEVPNNFSRKALIEFAQDGLTQALTSEHSVSWRLLDFFSNHFSVSANNRLMAGLAATLEREAIAPNLLGNFSDMLVAVSQHPAMLIYLNNERSFGPNSKAAKRREVGLNENLAREILELHTLGVNGPYSQQDVIELAKAITGWSVKDPNRDGGAGFVFRPYGHEPGHRKLLGKTYRQETLKQGESILKDLAVHPSTAKFLCFKLAHHFVSEQPQESLLTKMETTWLESNGNIRKVMTTMFKADEAWIDSNQKYKSPREFVISAYRAFGIEKTKNRFLQYSLNNLGQQPFNAKSPAGYSDSNDDWLGPSALMARIDWSSMVAGYQKGQDVTKIMSRALGSDISELTFNTVKRAESREQSIALLLMSPEFQWR